jgi:hypothetical protein
MAHEHSRNATEDSDTRSEESASVSRVAAAKNFYSALAQLNDSGAFGRGTKSSVDMTPENLPYEKPNVASGKTEIVTPSAAPTTAAPPTAEDGVASGLSNGRGEEHNADGVHNSSRDEMPSFDSPEVPAVGAMPEDPANLKNNNRAFSLLDAVDASGRVRKRYGMTGEESHSKEVKFAARGRQAQNISVSSVPTDYQSALLQIIESAVNDPRELRRLIYELARANLNREIGQGDTALGRDEMPECVLALETAIARVEVDLSRSARSGSSFPAPASPDESSIWDNFQDTKAGRPTDNSTDRIGSGALVPLEPQEPSVLGLSRDSMWPRPRPAPSRAGTASPPRVEIVYPERDQTVATRVRRRVWLWFIVWPLILLICPAVFCLVLYMALAGKLDVQQAQTRQAIVAEAQQSASTAAPSTSEFPLPSTYGVYAVSNGQLSELLPLPIRAPDPRVQLSAEINKPSSSELADGKVVFILFRRELLNDAPQKVAIRVVARVASALTFSSGKAAAAKPDASWHIRGNSYEFLVSPLNENREMVVVRPMDKDFALPSGRYALVFGGLAYDFTIAGPITEPAQCLESFEAVNGPVFTECRPK